MTRRLYPAELFRTWLAFMRDDNGEPVSLAEAARLLGCHRNVIPKWQRDGPPWYIGLACETLARGGHVWQPPRGAHLKPWEEPRSLRPAKPKAPKRLKAEKLKTVRWTKAAS